MASFNWYLRRLRKMSPTEIIGRLQDARIKQMWRIEALRPKIPPAHRLDDRRLRLPPVDALPLAVSPEARQAVIAEARRIMAGRVTILGHESTALGVEPDWFIDIRSGKHAPKDVYCFDVPYRDAAKVGEIKFVWESSRHHHLTLLAAAHYLTGETAFAERVAAHLTSWWRENPFLMGVHWTSGIEIGIRLLSWVWLRRLLSGWGGSAALFEQNPVFLSQLFHHQAYLSAMPSHGSSANNHLVAEICGLFAAAAAFPLFPQSGAWKRQAACLIEREVAAQTFPDGLNRELATSYHGLTLELFLVAALEDDPSAPALPSGVWHWLEAMIDAVAAFLDASGRAPRQGDDDGAFALLLDGAPFDRWGSLLATGRALFGACPWWPSPAHGTDVRSALLAQRGGSRSGDSGPDERPTADSCPAYRRTADLCPAYRRTAGPRPTVRRSLFVEAGMVILRDLLPDPNELWVRCDHGPLGFLATAAHGHADALSVEVRHGGIDILCDPGTYCYHGHDPWRAYFRSTLGHNTLELDGIDQCQAGGLFIWMEQPRSELLSLHGVDQGTVAEWIAAHHGYQRLAVPAVHRRRVRLDRQTRSIELTDWVESAGPHPGRLAFHLGPHVQCELHGHSATLSWENAKGGKVGAELHLPEPFDWSRHRGEETPILGWYSPDFGLLEPTTVLIGVGSIGNEEVTTRLVFHPALSPDPAPTTTIPT